jgi:mono/diheme cytochrome c family protein|tara:strand:+ start:313 stop:633 length:321 start_codon:yes stop_codon:yes gene_type:complete
MKKRYIYLIFFLFSNMIFIQTKSDPVYELGKDIFLNKGGCASCHTLSDAGSNGAIGPNLNQLRPDISRVMTAVTNGIGVMPAYESQLNANEIKAVSYYVSISSEKD